ncbi:hypothetical protein [Picosynechococcus sp. PCC 8807]|uniref:hypothetical protein n=1 Tax=Picosynechococcus sp. PCC 8807 TaxID=195248 RepID=UPI000AF5DF68
MFVLQLLKKEKIMNETKNSKMMPDDDLLPEYNFDYSKAHPNRFVAKQRKSGVTVVLEPDVAQVFTTSESVNKALRAILSAIPQ